MGTDRLCGLKARMQMVDLVGTADVNEVCSWKWVGTGMNHETCANSNQHV